jgi:DNA-binding XRE family transcriptional regulator
MSRPEDERVELAPSTDLLRERRARVQARVAELISEEKSLRDLRRARRLTQQNMAKKLGVTQHSVSRLEQRTDMLLSTLTSYIDRMGGELVLTARFPDRNPVRIIGFGNIFPAKEVRSSQRVHPAAPGLNRSPRRFNAYRAKR